MFTDDDEETGSGSGHIIPGTPSDSDDEFGKISTPMVAKKNFKLQLKDFDMSVVESVGAPNVNQTMFTAPTISPQEKEAQALRDKTVEVVDAQRRRVPRVEYSSDEEDSQNQQCQLFSNRPQPRSNSNANSNSIKTIVGTPSSSARDHVSSSGSETMSSFEFEQAGSSNGRSSKSKPKQKNAGPASKPRAAASSSSGSSGSASSSSRPRSHHTASPSKAKSNDQSTLLLDDLAEQVSQIGLNGHQGHGSESDDGAVGGIDVADLGRQMQNASIEEVTVHKVPPEVIDIDSSIEFVEPVPADRERPVQRPLESLIQRAAEFQTKQQQQRQKIYLPDVPPMSMPAVPPQSQFSLATQYAVSDEIRGSLGSMINNLQKIISSIPKEDAVDLLGKPSLLKVDLYSHQKYGLQWLWWREQQIPYGGILADEMGLGKTVMVLALICRGKMQGAKENHPSEWRSTENKRLVPSRGTLVVCPASVMGQWEAEVTKKARGLKVLVYHGASRPKSSSVLAQYDCVITTYNTLGAEIPKLSEQTAEACRSPVIRVSWLRVVLDEGHIIRNPKTGGAQAACRLTAQHRWVVTGTPVHNKPADMFSLVKFLRLAPFDDLKVWTTWIGMKEVKGQNAIRLHTISKALLLRRTKEEVMTAQQGESLSVEDAAIQTIPPKTVRDILVDLKEDEKEVYDHLSRFATEEFRAFLKCKQQRTEELQRAADLFMAGKRPPRPMEEKSFTHIFTLILRMRQCAVLPHLINTMIEEDDDVNNDESFDPVEDLISLKNPVFSEDFQSAKLHKMYEDLDNLKRECKLRGERMEKVVVVSQWTSLLKIVEQHLSLKGYSLATISGEVKIRDRTDIMGKFNADPKRPQIMLLSLAAGGVGLNLIGANHLFFLDIHFNPQLELQAQDRIHRFGQKKPVSISRYISRGTIEEKIVELQKKKLELADGILNNAQKKNGGGLSIPEMRQLFDV